MCAFTNTVAHQAGCRINDPHRELEVTEAVVDVAHREPNSGDDSRHAEDEGRAVHRKDEPGRWVDALDAQNLHDLTFVLYLAQRHRTQLPPEVDGQDGSEHNMKDRDASPKKNFVLGRILVLLHDAHWRRAKRDVNQVPRSQQRGEPRLLVFVHAIAPTSSKQQYERVRHVEIWHATRDATGEVGGEDGGKRTELPFVLPFIEAQIVR